MSKFRHTRLLVRVTELQTHPVIVPDWIVPILQAMHGDDAQVIEEGIILPRIVPNAAKEYQRLADCYRGEDGASQPYVTAVYGAFGPGTQSLARAIEAAQVTEEAPTAVAPPPEQEDALADLLADTA